MVEFSENTLYSFLFDRKIKPEIRIKRVYLRRGIKHVDYFYAERTQFPNIFLVPASILEFNRSGDSIHGYSGTAKKGDYFMGNTSIPMNIKEAVQIYSGAGFLIT